MDKTKALTVIACFIIITTLGFVLVHDAGTLLLKYAAETQMPLIDLDAMEEAHLSMMKDAAGMQHAEGSYTTGLDSLSRMMKGIDESSPAVR